MKKTAKQLITYSSGKKEWVDLIKHTPCIHLRGMRIFQESIELSKYFLKQLYEQGKLTDDDKEWKKDLREQLNHSKKEARHNKWCWENICLGQEVCSFDTTPLKDVDFSKRGISLTKFKRRVPGTYGDESVYGSYPASIKIL